MIVCLLSNIIALDGAWLVRLQVWKNTFNDLITKDNHRIYICQLYHPGEKAWIMDERHELSAIEFNYIQGMADISMITFSRLNNSKQSRLINNTGTLPYFLKCFCFVLNTRLSPQSPICAEYLSSQSKKMRLVWAGCAVENLLWPWDQGQLSTIREMRGKREKR